MVYVQLYGKKPHSANGGVCGLREPFSHPQGDTPTSHLPKIGPLCGTAARREACYSFIYLGLYFSLGLHNTSTHLQLHDIRTSAF